ncbi:MAG: single-stranded DNA-binding protein [Clostridia bacterium]|nr:single-stranded DNA-binding protein [Clostridia bacterium]
MTLAKAVVTGYVYRNPEKRFTQNNISVSAFVLNIGDKEEMLIRVISKRTALNDVIDEISKGDRVLVEGRLQIANVKSDDGSERRIYEIDANDIEKMSSDAVKSSKAANTKDEIVKFAEEEFVDELISEDEIPF